MVLLQLEKEANYEKKNKRTCTSLLFKREVEIPKRNLGAIFKETAGNMMIAWMEIAERR